jgi:hypothetical protein
MRRYHYLKTDPYVWDLVAQGVKTFEIRYNDRDYQRGDRLILDKTKYTGAEMKAGAPLEYGSDGIECEVLHVFKGPLYGLLEGWCILSIQFIVIHKLAGWGVVSCPSDRSTLTKMRANQWERYFVELRGACKEMGSQKRG